MGCDPVTYSGVTPEVFKRMKKKLEEGGIHVPAGDHGTLSGGGVSADFKWDGKSRLTIEVTKKPFFASCSLANSKLKEFVDESKKG